MLDNLLKVLKSNDWAFTNDQIIFIAKGKYELPITKKEKRDKRKWMYRIYFHMIKNIRLSRKVNKEIEKIKDKT